MEGCIASPHWEALNVSNNEMEFIDNIIGAVLVKF